ncbi:hypothetical protein MTR67_034361 [Solanum verrucosum]|uniref:Uncharacterized protein n=1 Tax=Solanum verrucosum TaxID=315347 RepID=A0AAF0U894_SOLVR|nr:hypothetical protein MTR67_034361 [Solanum verrucosum]
MHWNLKVCVIRLWIVPDKLKLEIPYSLEMILQDEKVLLIQIVFIYSI